MDLKTVSFIRRKLKNILDKKDVLDVVLFGSVVKGKAVPGDVDIAIISKKTEAVHLEGFHISLLSPEDFFVQPPSLITTLLREGYSLKYRKFLAERYQFLGRVLFIYEVASLNPSLKVKIVTTLRGKKNNKGMVDELGGVWLANQVFQAPLMSTHLFEQFFLNFHVPFKKYFMLIN